VTEGHTVVLGGGCAGLAAAWRLGKRGISVVLVEASDHVGGLAGGVQFGGNVYEYGPHIFHTTDAELLAEIKELMGDDLLPYKRTIQIKFLGGYFKFPLSMTEVFFKLSPWTLVRAAASFLYHFTVGALSRPSVENTETVLQRYYGDVLYRIFFKDYIERVWGIPPSEFSPSFARQRIPRLNVLEIFDKFATLFWKKARGGLRTEGYVEKTEGGLYTTREGFSMITKRLGERLVQTGCEFRLNTRVQKILREGDRVIAVSLTSQGKSETLPCAAVINTTPINECTLSFSPSLGAGIDQAARSLRFRALVFVGIRVCRPQVLPASFMYFREHVFNRITDLSHFSFDIDPPGSTLLIAEVSCDPQDAVWRDEIGVKEAVIEDLERESILDRSEIEETVVFRAQHAHPIYTLGHEDALQSVLKGLGMLENFETAGRQGRFQYVNTHVAMKMGYEAADHLIERMV